MQTIKTVAGQTLYDLAVTAYGNVDAAFALLAENPALDGLDLGAPLPVGLELTLPEEKTLTHLPALRALSGAIVANAPTPSPPLPTVPTVDSDLQAFLTAAEITNPALTDALAVLITALKRAGIWQKTACMYPMVGETETAHAINLRAPGTYNLIFYNNPTHTEAGVEFDGISQYANTGYNLHNASDWVKNSALAWYDTTAGGVEVNNWVMGVGNTATGDPLFGLFVRRQGNVCGFDAGNSSAGARTVATVPTAMGFTLGSIVAQERLLYKDGILVGGPNGAADSPSLPTGTMYLGVMNPTAGNAYYAQCGCAFAAIHDDGLTEDEATVYNQIVQDFQLAVGRPL